ncbi:MAG: mechanosensitive ion channel protein MscS [Candidatus Cloacimonadota bacterium]|nr:MAG: mechanosensitive ion channel protein MscS [Candidatus Cloacimonadota bacterium]
MREITILLEKWQESIIRYLPKLMLGILLLLIFYFIAGIFKKLSLRFYSKIFKKESNIAKIISSVIYFFFLLSGVFLCLEVMGLDAVLTKLLAGAGIIGIVAGFAFKDIVSNMFAGFLIYLQRPFEIGDWVDMCDSFGTVQTIGLITTAVKNTSGQVIFIPNQLIYNNSFSNYSVFGKRRVVFKTGVSYGDDLDLVKKTALEEINLVSGVLKEEDIDFYFTGIGSSAYNFEVRFWISFEKQTDYLEAMSETIVRIKKRFEKENISLAYSVMTLDFGVKGGVNLFDKALKIENTQKK